VSLYVRPVGWAIRFVAPGAKPEVVERYTSYLTTPTLSVDAFHVSVAVLPETPTARPVGADGAVVSGTTALTSFDVGETLPAASSAATL
jgi:hypothetical protein